MWSTYFVDVINRNVWMIFCLNYWKIPYFFIVSRALFEWLINYIFINGWRAKFWKTFFKIAINCFLIFFFLIKKFGSTHYNDNSTLQDLFLNFPDPSI